MSKVNGNVLKKMDWQNSTLKGKNSKERTKVWQFCSPSDRIAQIEKIAVE